MKECPICGKAVLIVCGTVKAHSKTETQEIHHVEDAEAFRRGEKTAPCHRIQPLQAETYLLLPGSGYSSS